MAQRIEMNNAAGIMPQNTQVLAGASASESGLQAKDAKGSATAPKFGEILNQIQSKYGEKPEKPREVKKTLGKDDFLKIMISQLKNQDPTSPFKSDQMATQIAQFTSVEQLQNVNQNLKQMAGQNKPLEQMAMTQMIGKVVTLDRERFPHVEGQPDSLSFHLNKDASHVRVAVISETGETVLEKDLGKQKAGEASFTWDGVRSNTLPAKSGNYMLRIEAKDDQGRSIETNPLARSRIVGVSFEGQEPIFMVGDGNRQEKISFRNIIRIEQPLDEIPPQHQAILPQAGRPIGIQGGNPPTLQAGQPPQAAQPGIQAIPNEANGPHFFTFKKGVGSMPVDEKGFPNGLSEMESQGLAPENSKQLEKGGDKG